MIHIGQELAEARLRKNLTVQEVAKATKIKPQFLLAIEKGEYHKLPSSAYAQGFVRNYAEFLGLPVDKTLALFRREFDEKVMYKVLPEGLAQQEFPAHKVRLQQGALLVVSILLAVIIYVAFQYRFAFISPPLEVTRPKDGEVIKSQTVTVVGKTDANASLFVNNEPVSLESDGTFRKDITVFPGKTSIKIKSVNQFGREIQVERQIEVK